jgi:chemotaxis protein methyltransferase CheR
VTREDFRFLAGFLRERSGLVLSDDKTYLVESRLVPVARKRGLAGLDALVALVRGGSDPAVGAEVVEAMTTNESFFFRDIRPFDSLRDVVLPALVAARRAAGAGRIRIWSAACASGQEPYSIAMLLAEHPALLQGLTPEIVGTDLSSAVLAKAMDGLYTQFEAQRGLPIRLLVKYFRKVGAHWQIDEALRRQVALQQANLLHDLGHLGRFDIVFCRNVLIYFDAATRRDVVARIAAMMAGDGYLVLGGAETVLGVSDAFTAVPGERAVYRAGGAGGVPMAKSA